MVETLSASPGFTRPCAECGMPKRVVYIAGERVLCEVDYVNYRAMVDRLDYANLDEIYAADREAEEDEPELLFGHPGRDFDDSPLGADREFADALMEHRQEPYPEPVETQADIFYDTRIRHWTEYGNPFMDWPKEFGNDLTEAWLEAARGGALWLTQPETDTQILMFADGSAIASIFGNEFETLTIGAALVEKFAAIARITVALEEAE